MILLIAGTRPEVIKLAPVYRQLQKQKLNPQWLWTGQSRDLGPGTFRAFGMRPEHEVDLPFLVGGALVDSFARLSVGISEKLKALQPEMVIVQGDTLTAAVGAQMGFLSGVWVAHVEAGLRTWDLRAPYPEEACRMWIDDVADLKFAPTFRASLTLNGPGVFVTGNTGIDAVEMIPKQKLSRLEYAVVTMHRRENADGVRAACMAVKKLCDAKVFESILWPVHPNPIVSETVPKYLEDVEGVELCRPRPYDQMVNLLRYAKLVITDSGGIQEECLAVSTPCLVMRESTERPEGIDAGGAKLVGTDPVAIEGWARWLMRYDDEWEAMANAPNPYGDGRAAQRIGKVIEAVVKDRQIDPKQIEWTGVTR